jgi:hypothetical protein
MQRAARQTAPGQRLVDRVEAERHRHRRRRRLIIRAKFKRPYFLPQCREPRLERIPAVRSSLGERWGNRDWMRTAGVPAYGGGACGDGRWFAAPASRRDSVHNVPMHECLLLCSCFVLS